jgi:O-antigen/teichoic acid export membrane protein
MLLGQSAINLFGNIFSAAFGLLNVIIFTRLFAPEQYGIYVLGAGIAAIANTALSSWLRLPIQREQARGDGTDVRGLILVGLPASWILSPIAYVAARLIGLSSAAAIAAVCFAIAMSYFEIIQDLLRAQLRAYAVMKTIVIRAVLIPVFAIAFSLLDRTGVYLLISSALAYGLAVLPTSRHIWQGARFTLRDQRLMERVLQGAPLTVSLTLLAVSSVIDRFIVAHFIGAGVAGTYTAGVDLVRQALIIPAISLAAAFFPLAVRNLAREGADAVRSHLAESLELFVAIMLPASVGLALTSTHVANLVLGPNFRALAISTMPVVSIAVILQVLNYQYLHISFLLSNRNIFYLISTGITVIIGIALAVVLTVAFGPVGTAWARLVDEGLGMIGAAVLSRWAFPVPFMFARLPYVLTATTAMAVVVTAVDQVNFGSDAIALSAAVAAGAVTYLAICFATNVVDARQRLRQEVLRLKTMLARRSGNAN